MPEVTLREITKETLDDVLDLKVAPDQKEFVAPNAVSVAEAYFAREAWFRGIYADDTPVGFLMLADQPDKPRYYLWRFMIDAEHQGRGYGKAAMDLLMDHVRTRPGGNEMFLSYVPAEGGPEHFYAKLGFADTGRVKDGEREMRREL